MLSPVLALLVLLMVLFILVPGRPDDGLFFEYFVFASVVLVFPLVLMSLPKCYEVESKEILARYIFGRRRLSLPLDREPLIVSGKVFGSPDFSVCNRQRIVRFHEVENQDEFRRAVQNLLPQSGVRVVPRQCTYAGITLMHIFAGAMFLLIATVLFVLVGAMMWLGGRNAMWLLSMPVPVLLVALIYFSLGLNVRVHREGSVLSATNMFRGVTHRLDVTDATSTSHESLFSRAKIKTASSSFALPISFGTDRRMVYDVFAIAAGACVFADEHPSIAAAVEE
jgi:hypothetical protein